jgi:hypothetical protein
MIDQMMGYLKVVVSWQMSHEHKIYKCISYADIAGFWLVNSWINQKWNRTSKYQIILQPQKLNTIVILNLLIAWKFFVLNKKLFGIISTKLIYLIAEAFVFNHTKINHEIWHEKKHEIHVISYLETWHKCQRPSLCSLKHQPPNLFLFLFHVYL